MQESRDPIRDVAEAVLGGLRQIGDCSYAILPKDIAHSVANVKKALLGQLTNALRLEMDWIDDRVAGGDKLREEWREKGRQRASQAGQ
ncbi:MAG TPA: hypothetical protein VFS90_02690 [Pyrinomonadaceae bacterium]|nr:hypothetical protein [Pyrinomonadaceae bacterium]